MGILYLVSLGFESRSLAQSTEIQSHYPESAFIINRMIPFQVLNRSEGEDGANVTLSSVGIEGDGECSSAVDSHYPDVFHVICRTPGSYNVIVRSRTNGVNEVLVINGLEISDQVNAPEPSDEEGQ